jgi:signal transduction histidine kinase
MPNPEEPTDAAALRPFLWLRLIAVAAVVLTVLVSVTSAIHFAYRSPSLHVAVETAAALISLLAAQLVYGRFRRSRDRRDLLLMAALALFAGSNLLFSALPAMANAAPDSFFAWARMAGGVTATSLLAISAFGSERPLQRPAGAVRRLLLSCGIALLAIGVATALAKDWLPQAVEPGLSPESSSRPRIIGHPVVLTLQLVLMALFAAAAVGFARRADRTQDPMITWFAIGAGLGGWARLNYFLFPSLYSEYFYTGDVLRLGFFVALLIGGAMELRLAQRALARDAMLDERRRLAREIHDGIAQDLAYIVQQGDALASRPDAPEGSGDIATAARRALGETRGVIQALVRPLEEPLETALERVARDVAARGGATVQADMEEGVELPAQTSEALLRIVGEAVNNAVRHGEAQTIRLHLRCGPQLRLSIDDDGSGFDPAALGSANGHHGIRGMRERVDALGGELQITSRPGDGATVLVTLP